MFLYYLVITPIETVVEWVFNFFTVKFESLGVIGAVCGVSLVINLLALPLYNVADRLQEKERKAAKALEPRVKRIKKAFKGNEQFMMLSTYYRQNDYHPLYVLRSSLSILIEIPFFIAAYHYLSHCEILKGSSFWIFKDLGSPDGLLHIGNLPVHVLPIIMTLINFVSGAIYTKDAPFREKIQLYLVAVLFLVLLYRSPSGLVIYWILNNLFSLAKNIVMKTKHPGRVLHAAVSVLLLSAAVYLFTTEGAVSKRILFLAFVLCIVVLPFCKKHLTKLSWLSVKPDGKTDLWLLLSSGAALTLLYGFLLPSSVVSSSPMEFSFLGDTDNPMSYVWYSVTVFAGFFILWPSLIFALFGRKIAAGGSLLLFTMLLVSILNAYVFKASYGTLNVFLEVFDAECLVLGRWVYLASLLAGTAVIVLSFALRKSRKASRFLPLFVLALCLGEFGMGCMKSMNIKETYEILEKSRDSENRSGSIEKEYSLTRMGKNVFVLFLDRAIGSFVPLIFEEFPEIGRQFEGFTYYPNTVSFSGNTVTAAPGMLGGYEYTQEKMNERKDELLREKHNEAILVMPKLFSDAGFEVTVTDPPWPNYRWSEDYDFIKKYPGIKMEKVGGKYKSNFIIEKGIMVEKIDDFCRKGFIDFDTLQCLPPFLRKTFYKTARRKGSNAETFFSQLSSLYYLPQMTDFSAEKDTFTFIENDTTHDACISLSEDYETPSAIQVEDPTLQHYQANVAALKQVGKWLDFLREKDCLDNTRIIIVSDHGANVDVPSHNDKVALYSAFLMVKDFGSRGSVKTDARFMTNADTLFLAKEGLPVSDTNPFTEKKLLQEKENGVKIYSCLDWNCEHLRKDTQFELDKNQAWHVRDNIFDEKNWIPLAEWEESNGGRQ